MRSILKRVSLRGPNLLHSFRGRRRGKLWVIGTPTLREFVFEPQIVMFFGPVEIDLAGSHGLERALHSERADINVGEDQGDKQNRNHAVYDLRDLHSEDIGDIEWKQQQKA